MDQLLDIIPNSNSTNEYCLFGDQFETIDILGIGVAALLLPQDVNQWNGDAGNHFIRSHSVQTEPTVLVDDVVATPPQCQAEEYHQQEETDLVSVITMPPPDQTYAQGELPAVLGYPHQQTIVGSGAEKHGYEQQSWVQDMEIVAAAESTVKRRSDDAERKLAVTSVDHSYKKLAAPVVEDLESPQTQKHYGLDMVYWRARDNKPVAGGKKRRKNRHDNGEVKLRFASFSPVASVECQVKIDGRVTKNKTAMNVVKMQGVSYEATLTDFLSNLGTKQLITLEFFVNGDCEATMSKEFLVYHNSKYKDEIVALRIVMGDKYHAMDRKKMKDRSNKVKDLELARERLESFWFSRTATALSAQQTQWLDDKFGALTQPVTYSALCDGVIVPFLRAHASQLTPSN